MKPCHITLSSATRDRTIDRLCVVNGLIRIMEDSRPHDTLPPAYDTLIRERDGLMALLEPIRACKHPIPAHKEMVQ